MQPHNWITAGLKQRRNGELYIQATERTTREIKEVLIPQGEKLPHFDFRPSHGHLWKLDAETQEYQPASCNVETCSVCGHAPVAA